jgi:hypothetical protein
VKDHLENRPRVTIEFVDDGLPWLLRSRIDEGCPVTDWLHWIISRNTTTERNKKIIIHASQKQQGKMQQLCVASSSNEQRATNKPSTTKHERLDEAGTRRSVESKRPVNLVASYLPNDLLGVFMRRRNNNIEKGVKKKSVKPLREPIAYFYWSKGLTPSTQDMEAPLQSEGVSICFTNLYNMRACSGIDSLPLFPMQRCWALYNYRLWALSQMLGTFS